MTKNVIQLLILVFCINTMSAQETPINRGLGLGFQLSQYQRDFGVGLNFTSPYFAKEKIAVRLKGNLMFNENVQNSITKWTPYTNIFKNKSCNYFIEIGGVGTGATEDKIVLQPIYSNGFLISSGFRMHLK